MQVVQCDNCKELIPPEVIADWADDRACGGTMIVFRDGSRRCEILVIDEPLNPKSDVQSKTVDLCRSCILDFLALK